MQNALLFKSYVNIFYKGLKETDNFQNSNYSWHLDKLISSTSQDLELNLNIFLLLVTIFKENI